MKRLSAIIALCLCLLPLAPSGSAARTPIRVAFISPSPQGEQPFWDEFAAFMQEAARDLGMELEVVYARHRFEVEENADQIAHQEAKPDYLVYMYQATSTRSMLPMLEQTGIKSVIVNTDTIPLERPLVGAPREIYPHWIGHIYPDDHLAGRMLADRLILQGIENGLTDNDRLLHMVGIGGSRDATSGTYRMNGLMQALESHPRAVLDRFVWADWQRDKARTKTLALLDYHPDARVYWAVHGDTALGILDAVEELGIKAGKSFLTGGIGWSADCLRAVREGRLEAAIGGHFMEGAWSLIMIFDYHHGHDFAAPDPTLQSEMRLIDSSNLDTYAPLLDPDNWKKIDFRLFSKTYNPRITEYDFSPDAVVRQLSGN